MDIPKFSKKEVANSIIVEMCLDIDTLETLIFGLICHSEMLKAAAKNNKNSFLCLHIYASKKMTETLMVNETRKVSQGLGITVLGIGACDNESSEVGIFNNDSDW